MMKDIVMYEEKKDIRKIPPKKWEACQISTDVIGKWIYFYPQDGNTPINSSRLISSMNPGVEKSMGYTRTLPKNFRKSLPLRDYKTKEHFDWYDLRKADKIHEKNLQSLKVQPTIVVPEQSESKTLTRSLGVSRPIVTSPIKKNSSTVAKTSNQKYRSIFPPCWELTDD